jgi:hypothetical protein
MWIWSYAVRIYYALKHYYDAYFKGKNELLKPKKDKDPKITKLETEIKELYDTIDIKYVYNCLRILNKDYNENSRLKDIVNFLEEEAKFILKNKDNLEISLNKIKENTYVLELISKFKLLDEIHKKEMELNKLNRK